jgi:hypothetical protein
MVKELHRDLWYNADPSTRQTREEALKRVNVAYDELRSSAT